MAKEISRDYTVLVTGGAGFIGSAFVRHLLRKGVSRVVNLDLLTYAGSLKSLEDVADDPRHVFVRGDCSDQDLVSDLLAQYAPMAVVHMAAQTHVDRSIDGPEAFVETNIVGTQRLLHTCMRYWRDLPRDAADRFRFINVSTDEVYGSLGATGRFTEESPYAPNSPYAASKAAADHLARAYWMTYRLPVITTHSSNNYGPYQFPEKLIPLCTIKALRQERVPVYGDGQQVRDWLHVDDHCAALALILTKGVPGETYNIAAGDELPNLRVVQLILSILDELVPLKNGSSYLELIAHVDDRPGHDRRYAMDSSTLRQELGWSLSVPFDAGLRSTVEWYLKNSLWVENATAGNYSLERLGAIPQAPVRVR